jgi:hypothetical protein
VSGNPWTPGPWLYQGFTEAGDTSGWYVVVAPHRVISVEGRDEEEADANARLIAAAPEMAEALEQVVDYFAADTEPHWLGETARALLSRIRGDAP